MRDPATVLQTIVVAVVLIGAIGAVWSLRGFGELYERIGNQLFLSRRSAAPRPAARKRSRARPSRQLQAIDAALSAPASTPPCGREAAPRGRRGGL